MDFYLTLTCKFKPDSNLPVSIPMPGKILTSYISQVTNTMEAKSSGYMVPASRDFIDQAVVPDDVLIAYTEPMDEDITGMVLIQKLIPSRYTGYLEWYGFDIQHTSNEQSVEPANCGKLEGKNLSVNTTNAYSNTAGSLPAHVYMPMSYARIPDNLGEILDIGGITPVSGYEYDNIRCSEASINIQPDKTKEANNTGDYELYNQTSVTNASINNGDYVDYVDYSKISSADENDNYGTGDDLNTALRLLESVSTMECENIAEELVADVLDSCDRYRNIASIYTQQDIYEHIEHSIEQDNKGLLFSIDKTEPSEVSSEELHHGLMDTMVDALQADTSQSDQVNHQGLLDICVTDSPELFVSSNEVYSEAGMHPVLYTLNTDRVITDGSVVAAMDGSTLVSGYDPDMMIVTGFAYANIAIVHHTLS